MNFIRQDTDPGCFLGWDPQPSSLPGRVSASEQFQIEQCIERSLLPQVRNSSTTHVTCTNEYMVNINNIHTCIRMLSGSEMISSRAATLSTWDKITVKMIRSLKLKKMRFQGILQYFYIQFSSFSFPLFHIFPRTIIFIFPSSHQQKKTSTQRRTQPFTENSK